MWPVALEGCQHRNHRRERVEHREGLLLHERQKTADGAGEQRVRGRRLRETR